MIHLIVKFRVHTGCGGQSEFLRLLIEQHNGTDRTIVQQTFHAIAYVLQNLRQRIVQRNHL